MSNCTCGSGTSYAECCQPVITGAKPAETAEQLMRARYSAYVVADTDFIFASTHPEHRKDYDHEGTREWAENAQWEGLEIITTKNGGAEDTTGEVEFIARFREKEALREHHELALFTRKHGSWLFTEGAMVRPRPVVVIKTGRNDPCPCSSGLKYKKCCGK